MVVLALVLVFAPAAWQVAAAQNSAAKTAAPTQLSDKAIQRIIKEVHHELVLLPFYGVFDNLAYKVDGDGTVTLLGQTVRPTLKSDAENVVKRIEGVERVVNQIEVLPLSPNDDRIRRAVFRAIYTEMNARLQLQAMQLEGPIEFLSDEEGRRSTVANAGTIERPWEVWKKQALGR